MISKNKGGRRSKPTAKMAGKRGTLTAACLTLSLVAAITMTVAYQSRPGPDSRLKKDLPRQKNGKVSDAGVRVESLSSPSKEYIYAGGRLVATEEPTTASPVPAPTNLDARAISNTQIRLTWSWSDPQNPAPVDYYEVQKTDNFSNPNGWTTLTPNPGSTSITYTVTSGNAYMYRVRAVRGGTPSGYSDNDLATAIIFTDDPLSPPNSILIKAIHLTQVRDAVNAVRRLANPTAYPQVTNWMDPSPQGVSVKAQHMLELRSYLNPALTALGLSSLPNDSSIGQGNQIKGAHLQDAREKVR